MKNYLTIICLISALSFLSNNVCAQIKLFNESASNFNNPPEIDTSRGKFLAKDMYRAYRKAGTGFSNIGKTKRQLEKSIHEFASKKRKLFVILGQRASTPPYIGTYPRVEIIFALIDN